MMQEDVVTILENRKVNEKYFKLVFASKKLARGVVPGQFMQVQIQPSFDPLLRRPFSYYRVQGDRIEVLYEILGRGTDILSQKAKGSRLRILGPLGKPFSRPQRGKTTVLVAGGIGLPPLVFFAEKNKADFLLIGAKSRDEVLPSKELAKVSAKVLYATNDGTYGKKGYVTVLLEALIEKQEDPQDLFIQTCGPKVMMQAVIDLARKYEISGEASIDETMGCGVGACLGCMVETDKGLVPSCTAGPVFAFETLRQSLV
jgi:dihydroorotate dehydrogenase electron transfer subunit